MQLAGNLSGGNQQKVSLAKWLAADTEIIIIDEPTVGIDVRTKANFHELIMDLADEGMAVLLISSDLPEMVAIADRIMVMRDYKFVGEFPNSKDYAEMSTKVMDAIHSGSPRQNA
jgi:ribose transport system ATP-binding protein